MQQVMSQIAAVKKDMIILEKSEFSTLLAENEVGVRFHLQDQLHKLEVLLPSAVSLVNLFLIFFNLTETQDPVIPAQCST